MMQRTINLKKYPNRKLYASKGQLGNEGMYVTHKDLLPYIKQGHKIVVKSTKDKSDITFEVLKEILTDSSITLDTDLMHQLIKNNYKG